MANILFDALVGNTDPDRMLAKIEDGRFYTYAHAIDVSGRLAHRIVSWGVEPGDRVAVQAPKSIEAIMLYLACLRAGAVFLPLNTAYTPAEVEYFLQDAEARLFICDPEKADILQPVADKCGARLETLGLWKAGTTDGGTLLEESGQNFDPFENVPREAGDLAAILYTSGTTGRSKGAMLSHFNLLSNARTLREYWHFTQDDMLLHALPIFHTHGLFVATNIAMLAGCRMHFQHGFNVDKIIEALPECTAMMGVPTFYTRLLDDDRLNREVCSNMRLFISGSAPLLADTHVAFEARTGYRILERYGMTETNMNTSNPYDGERRAGTVGFPLPDVQLRIVDPDSGKAVSQGEVGIIEVKGPNVFSGYWQMPEKTAEEFTKDGFFITGDMAREDEDGYIHIVGRAKDLVISGGYNIYPKEIEAVLDECDGVLESAVIGVPHPDFGEAVVAILVPNAEATLDTKLIEEQLADQLARFKQPKSYIVADALPRNTMGKVQKNVLRDQNSSLFNS